MLVQRAPRVLHIITDLDIGGAETALLDLIRSARDCEHHVLSLSTIGPVGARISKLGCEVEALGMRRAPTDVLRFGSLIRRIRRWSGDLVHTWMIHANVVGGLAARASLRVPIVWSLRHGQLDPRHTPRATMALDRFAARVSHRIPTRIVSCSRATVAQHLEAGYDGSRIVYIPNGIDTARFRPDPVAAGVLRDELGIARGAEVVGMVARFDAQKDFATFAGAARLVADRRPGAHFLACGRGVPVGLAPIARNLRIADRIHLLEERGDIERVYAALDVACLSSAFGEAAPRTPLEALACGVPCVATDLGDARVIVDRFGAIVPTGCTGDLADAIVHTLEHRRLLKEGAREHVESTFSVERVTAAYTELYEELLT